MGIPKIKPVRGQTLSRTFCVTQWMPESPRFDILTGHTERAMATLTNIAKDNGKTMPQGRIIASKQVRLQIYGSEKGDVYPIQCLIVDNKQMRLLFLSFEFYRLTADRLKISSPLSVGGLLFLCVLFG